MTGTVFEAVYEENWGSRFPREYWIVLFFSRPSRTQAMQALEEEYPDLKRRGGLKESWFDYGPLSIKEKPVRVISS